MADLPVRFLDTMKKLLGEEYEAFLRGYDRRRDFGLRVNTLKVTLEEFERIAPFPLKKIPWIPNGYFYEEGDAPARHPFYAAGLYYLQEPSAMTPASRLPVQPGDRVLDLCAAPGGKATALGAALQGQGLLVANDINTARARALLRNMELFGIANAFVTNEAPYILAERFPCYFDKIMVDAPCSGEGMFRKNPAVAEAWLEKGPEYFSQLQREIILHGADMLRPGGLMFYSTCTFSPAENERTITHLLRERPEMEVVPMEDYEGFSEGLTSFDGEAFDESCRLCRRIWPHKMDGEGHFMALLR
ncbi:MAG: RsmB/NOP family class I SAM-dependent RNA methyltransferase [Clostridiales bacterium]|nr:RsmB/NOP family class I SAM-dependent RNA methyltransferase [Clostridiales bacterium]